MVRRGLEAIPRAKADLARGSGYLTAPAAFSMSAATAVGLET
jgi:hypothetical protein